MKDLTILELTEINGGSIANKLAPQVMNNPDAQDGYTVGWHIGHAIGNTIELFGDISDTLGISDWFN